MSDDLRNPIGTPAQDDDGATEGEVTEENYEEVEDMDGVISDGPTVENASERSGIAEFA